MKNLFGRITIVFIVIFALLSYISTTTSAATVSYRYIKWEITKRKGIVEICGNTYCVQAAELVLLSGASTVSWPSGTTATNPSGTNPINETPDKAIDSSTSTKWLDQHFDSDGGDHQVGNAVLIIDTGSGNSMTFDGYKWATANDASDRDPVSWNIYGSANGSTWTLLDTRTNETITDTRFTYTSTYSLSAAPTSTPTVTPSPTNTPTPTSTPTPTNTPTPTATPTSTPTPTYTPTPTATSTPIPTVTPSPTTTPMPTDTPTPTSTVIPISMQQTTSTPTPTPTEVLQASVCQDEKPTAAPDLFQIDRNGSEATIYFTPVHPANYYFVAYGEDSNAEQYGAQVDMTSEGVMSFTIEYLSPYQTYYFKVRAGNGCTPGPWSQIKTSEVEIITITPATISKIIDNKSSIKKTQKKLSPTSRPTEQPPSQISYSATPPMTSTPQHSTYSLDVKVVDNKNNPVNGAEVTLHSEIQIALTDENGVAHFDNVEMGHHKVLLAYNGYVGEKELKVDGKKKEQALTLQVNVTNGFSSPLVQITIVLMSLIIILLLTLLLIFTKSNKKKAYR